MHITWCLRLSLYHDAISVVGCTPHSRLILLLLIRSRLVQPTTDRRNLNSEESTRPEAHDSDPYGKDDQTDMYI